MKKQVRKCVVRNYVKRSPKKIIKDTILTTLRNAALEEKAQKDAELKEKEVTEDEKKAARKPKKAVD